MNIQGSFCSEPPHGFVYAPCELGKRLTVCLFYFIRSCLFLHTGMCACVLRNYFTDHFLLSWGHGAGPGPNVTAGSDVSLSLLHITARVPRHWPSHSTIFCHASIPSPVKGKPLRAFKVPVLTWRLFINVAEQQPEPTMSPALIGEGPPLAGSLQISLCLEGAPTAVSLAPKMSPLTIFFGQEITER